MSKEQNAKIQAVIDRLGMEKELFELLKEYWEYVRTHGQSRFRLEDFFDWLWQRDWRVKKGGQCWVIRLEVAMIIRGCGI